MTDQDVDVDDAPAAARRGMRRRRAMALLRLAVTAGLLWFLTTKIDIAHAVDLIARSPAALLVAAVGTLAATTPVNALRWRLYRSAAAQPASCSRSSSSASSSIRSCPRGSAGTSSGPGDAGCWAFASAEHRRQEHRARARQRVFHLRRALRCRAAGAAPRHQRRAASGRPSCCCWPPASPAWSPFW